MPTPLDLIWRFPLMTEPTGEGDSQDISCPLIPNMHSQADTPAEVLSEGYDGLLTALSAMVEEFQPIPECTYPVPAGSAVLILDPIPALKVGLYMALRERFAEQEAYQTALEDFHRTTGVKVVSGQYDPMNERLDLQAFCAVLKHFDLEASLTLPYLSEP